MGSRLSALQGRCSYPSCKKNKMTTVAENIFKFKKLLGQETRLVVVSKKKTNEQILEAYQTGQRDFGENRVQEIIPKFESLPKDIQWHIIGHLQTNKVKYIAPFIHLIQSVDSESLLAEINKQAAKCNRTISVLLQLFIAQEETKFGFSEIELEQLILQDPEKKFPHVNIVGFMGMASNTENQNQIRKEFQSLQKFSLKMESLFHNSNPNIISMGMSSDWEIALTEGSTMIRIGTSIFETI